MNPVEEFLLVKEAKDKQAGWLGDLGRAFMKGISPATSEFVPRTVGQGIASAMGQAVPGAATAGILGTAAYGIGKGYSAIKDRFAKQRDYQAMLEADPGLKRRPARQVQMMFNSLRKMAPTMSADPVIAASFIDNQLDLSGNRAVLAPQTAKTLADTQKSVTQGKGQNQLMNLLVSGAGALRPRFEGPQAPEFSFGRGEVSGRGFRTAEEADMMARRFPTEPRYSLSPTQGASATGLSADQLQQFSDKSGIPFSGMPTETRQYGPVMEKEYDDQGKVIGQYVQRDARGNPMLEQTGYSERYHTPPKP